MLQNKAQEAQKGVQNTLEEKLPADSEVRKVLPGVEDKKKPRRFGIF